jgi:hypothetical protein
MCEGSVAQGISALKARDQPYRGGPLTVREQIRRAREARVRRICTQLGRLRNVARAVNIVSGWVRLEIRWAQPKTRREYWLAYRSHANFEGQTFSSAVQWATPSPFDRARGEVGTTQKRVLLLRAHNLVRWPQTNILSANGRSAYRRGLRPRLA